MEKRKGLQVLLKPASSACNLRCRYCFYTDEAQKRGTADFGKMPEPVWRAVVEKALAAADDCTFAFQGGEPTLAGLPFYRAFTAYVQAKKAPSQRVFYTLQTNGTLLNGEWLSFFKAHDFYVGVSLDGPRGLHDRMRPDREGRGSFSAAFAAMRQMQAERIPFAVLCVLTEENARRIGSVYRFFCEKGFLAQQYLPCMPPLGEAGGLSEKTYGECLCELFDLWFADFQRGLAPHIRQFDDYLSILRGGEPEACAMYGCCLMQNVIEADGSVYPCDFYALDDFYMGNILETDFTALLQPALNGAGPFFAQAQRRGAACPQCPYYALCRGGCRRDCAGEGEAARNRYCNAYQTFFEYALPLLAFAAQRL